MTKPIRIMTGGLTNMIYAVRQYREMGDGLFVNTGTKDDVTAEAIAAVAEHRSRCRRQECSCQPGPWRCKCGELHAASVGCCPTDRAVAG